jgi:outer membrane protein assembly factor BamB
MILMGQISPAAHGSEPPGLGCLNGPLLGPRMRHLASISVALLGLLAARTTAWQARVGGEVHGRPTFSAGDGSEVYVAVSAEAAVVALSSRSGRVLWNLSLPCHPIDPIWQKEIKCGAVGSPLLSHDGSSLFVAGQDRALWRFALPKPEDANPPTVQWRYALGASAAGITAGLALSDDGSVIFVASGENKNTTDHRYGNEVHAVDSLSGRGLWAARRCGTDAVGAGPCTANTSPTYHAGLVLVGDSDGYLYALNASSGDTVWRYRGPLVAKGTDGSCKSSLYDTPVADDGRAFFGSNDCQLWAVNVTTGEHLWNVSFDGVIDGASPVVAKVALTQQGLVISGSDRQNASDPTAGQVMAINASTGTVVWSFSPPPGGVYSSPAASATTVYVAAPEASAGAHTGPAALFALQLRDGAVLWNFSSPSLGAKGAGGAVALSPDGRLAVFGGNDNNIYAVNTLTGRTADPSSSPSLPRPPYRAWAFPYNFTNETVLGMYHGTNLLPTWSSKYGGADVVRGIERQGVTVLKWASGPRAQWSSSGDYVQAMTPTVVVNGTEQMLYAGDGIDEWNTRNVSVECMAATGYRAAKRRWAGIFIAAWVTGIDATFSGLMQDGTFDIALIEGYSYWCVTSTLPLVSTACSCT